MGAVEKYVCDFCEFEYADDGAEFYFNDDLTVYDESMMLMRTVGKMVDSPLRGSIDLAYCSDCDEFVKVYTVSTNETDLSNEEIEKLILDNAFDDFGMGDFFNDEYEKDAVLDYLNEKKFKKIVEFDYPCKSIECVSCGKQLDIIKENVKCPKCGRGKIMAFLRACVD